MTWSTCFPNCKILLSSLESYHCLSYFLGSHGFGEKRDELFILLSSHTSTLFSNTWVPWCLFYFIFLKSSLEDDFRDRKGGREREKHWCERVTDCLPPYMPRPCLQPMCPDQESKLRNFGVRTMIHPSEPPGKDCLFLYVYLFSSFLFPFLTLSFSKALIPCMFNACTVFLSS